MKTLTKHFIFCLFCLVPCLYGGLYLFEEMDFYISENKEQINSLDVQGVIVCYKSFINTLIKITKIQQNATGADLKFELKFEFDNHDIERLRSFVEAKSISESLTLVQEVTEIVNTMFSATENYSSMETHKDYLIFYAGLLFFICK